MSVLSAVLAFALIMLVFSTMVSAIVEALTNRVFALRRREFRRLLERFYDDVVYDRYRGEVEASGTEPPTARDDARLRFVAKVGRDNKYTEDQCRAKLLGSRKRWMRWMPFREEPIAERMTSVVFAERLADTAYASAIAQRNPSRVEDIVNDLAREFEQFGESSLKRFRDRAQKWSMVVALAFCFLANVDAGRLSRTFLQDPELAAKLLEKSETVLKAARQVPDTAKSEETKQDIDEGLKQIEALKGELGTLRKDGLPIGYDFFPGCTITGNTTIQLPWCLFTFRN